MTGQIKNAFTRQAIPDVTVTLMRAYSTIIEDSLMAMALDGSLCRDGRRGVFFQMERR